MNAYGIAPCSRIHAIAQLVSSPPENAIPTRSPTGSDPRMHLARDAIVAHIRAPQLGVQLAPA